MDRQTLLGTFVTNWLGACALGSVVGVVILAAQGHEPPPILGYALIGSMGALAGYLGARNGNGNGGNGSYPPPPEAPILIGRK